MSEGSKIESGAVSVMGLSMQVAYLWVSERQREGECIAVPPHERERGVCIESASVMGWVTLELLLRR